VNHRLANLFDSDSADVRFPSGDRLPLAALRARLFSRQRLARQILVSALFKFRSRTAAAHFSIFSALFFPGLLRSQRGPRLFERVCLQRKSARRSVSVADIDAQLAVKSATASPQPPHFSLA